MKLRDLGLTKGIITAFQSLEDPTCSLGRIVCTRSQFYYVQTDTDYITTEVSGRLKFKAETKNEMPVIGDWVAVVERENAKGILKHILKRKNVLCRKVVGEKTETQLVASNIDAVIVMTAMDTTFNMSRLERFLTFVRQSGAEPIVVFNKVDLVDDIASFNNYIQTMSKNQKTFVISAKNNTGINPILGALSPKETVCVVGASGVGKSSLINRFLNSTQSPIGAVRVGDNKGRHTTRHKELFMLSNKALLIDTPGIRELQLWDDEGGLEDNFHDILEVASKCQFSDCQHVTEPGCEVNLSVERGELSQKRVENFKKQQKEIVSLNLKKTIHDRRKKKGFFSSLRKQKKHKNKPAIED